MIKIPNQLSVTKAFLQFDADIRIRPFAYYDRFVDIMENLVKFVLLRSNIAFVLMHCYSEHKEKARDLSAQLKLKSIKLLKI